MHVPYEEGGDQLVQIWDVRGPLFVKDDWRPGERFGTKLLPPPSKYNTLEKMLFNIGLITPFAKTMSTWMNERLTVKGQGEPGKEARADGVNDWERPTSEGEVLKFWGYMVCISLYPSVPVEEMWRIKRQPGDLFSPPAIGRHGMHKSRFKKLRELSALMFAVDESELDETDPWRYCRAPITAFNERRRRLVVPSWVLVGDEAMSAWTGEEGILDGIGSNSRSIPLLSFVPRKPEPLGAEIKVVADGTMPVFLGLEVQEGAEAHASQRWFDEYGHTTAVSLRLLEPWFKGPRQPSNPWFKGLEQPTRAYYGDSWFMGVNSAEAIFIESGKVIYPFGDVKTNTSRFPTAELRAACGPNSGDWAVFTSDVHLGDGSHLDVMAIAHRRGPEVHTYLSTHGVTTQGKPQRHKDDDLDAETGHVIARKCPSVLNDGTLAQPKIDTNNRRRQFDLAMEKRFRTEAFPFRLFTTVLGICLVDTFYLNQKFNQSKDEFNEACRRMAWALMYNNFDKITALECDPSDLYTAPEASALGESPFAASPTHSQPSYGHVPVPLHCIPGYTGGMQLNCAVCKARTTFACIACSTKDAVLPIHQLCTSVGQPSVWRCAFNHRKNPTKHAGGVVRPKGSKKVRERLKKAQDEKGEDEEEGDEEEGEEEQQEEEEGEEAEEGEEEEEEEEEAAEEAAAEPAAEMEASSEMRVTETNGSARSTCRETRERRHAKRSAILNHTTR